METAQKYIFDNAIDWPSADISYRWVETDFIATMHFSRVAGAGELDFLLIFNWPLAVSWEQESFNVIPIPDILPKIDSKNFGGWTYPTLWIEGSLWADRYAASLCAQEEYRRHDVRHYLLVSMNDILHVLSRQPPTTQWIQSS